VFLGEYDHSLDAKGRVILPSEHRDELGEHGYITKVSDGCLAIYTNEEFHEVANRMQQNARRGRIERNVARAFGAGSRPVAPDKQGRVPIPANLREFAGLQREVKVTGAINRIEIWDRSRWDEVNGQGEANLIGAGSGDAASEDFGF
jgi:MraZ protein